ncbi:putative Zn peptidase [Desulfoscipio gibsoniae DSM 7213]|uniref:Putative Zn peptidase n=2 Tax=Desulfoscipio gibsoniae TaxID=102134 RepID=R4KKU3_9FIRM|nr:putative Zn peptidase [Desulfoscipio gibsoniae DSM 7213]
MMGIDVISNEVRKIKRKYSETNPVKLCQNMKISLLHQPMGLFEGACKGFYLQQSRKQAIVINSDLDEQFQRIILMHELGHAVLHRKLPGVKSFHDFTLFDQTSLYEYEANIFAADFILDDQEVLRMLNDDISFFAAANTLCVPAELLDFKFRILKRKGYQVIDPPLNARANFLKNY